VTGNNDYNAEQHAHGEPALGYWQFLGVDDYATHRVALEEAPHAYEIFQKKQDGAFKVLLQPNGGS